MDPQEQIIDVERLVTDIRKRVARERAQGRYADASELAALGLQAPTALAQGFDLGGPGTRIRFRPELGFSSKRFIGPVITAVKRLNLRLIHFVLDDLARQANAAVVRLEAALAAETAEREALEQEVDSLTERLATLEKRLARERK